MNLHTLSSMGKKRSRRLGQGHGSGRGKTSGRGTKGQKARNKVPLRFEGGALVLVKRMPLLRGNQRNKAFKPKPVVINLDDLASLPAKAVVDVETLVKHNVVTKGVKHVKLLGDGEITAAYTVKVPTSKSAAEKIAKAGGTVE